MTAMSRSAAPVQSAATAPRNDDSAGYQPTPSVERTNESTCKQIGRSMNTVTAASMATPLPTEQSISVTLTAEVMHDLDDGRPTLIAATESNLGDLRETSPARLRGMVAQARAQLDRIERLANEHEARDTLRAIAAEHDLLLFEDDMSDLPQPTALTCICMYRTNGPKVVVVPADQNPIVRLAVIAELVDDLQALAAQA